MNNDFLPTQKDLELDREFKEILRQQAQLSRDEFSTLFSEFHKRLDADRPEDLEVRQAVKKYHKYAHTMDYRAAEELREIVARQLDELTETRLNRWNFHHHQNYDFYAVKENQKL